MAESLKEQHPDIVTIAWKWDRWQHHVDYTPFKKNKLIRKEGIIIKQGVDNYGMVLKVVENQDQEENEQLPIIDENQLELF
jgi:hypothetical protein